MDPDAKQRIELKLDAPVSEAGLLEDKLLTKRWNKVPKALLMLCLKRSDCTKSLST